MILQLNFIEMPSKTALAGIIMVFTGFHSLPAAGQQDTPCLAVITGVKGEVLVKKGGADTFFKINWGAQLSKGDQVKTSAGSEATLTFSDNGIIRLGEKSSITIDGNEPSSSRSTGEVKKISTATMVNITALTSRKEKGKDEGALAGLRSGDSGDLIELTAPNNSVLKTTRPSFSWKAAKPYDNYTLKLYNSSGLLWSVRVKGTSAEYPSDQKDLDYGGTYFWNVEGEDLIDNDRSGNNKFSILTADKSDEVVKKETLILNTFSDDRESSSYHSILGSFYIELGLLQDAITEFTIISRENPDTPLPHEILGSLYSEAGNKDRAIEELQKALALSKNNKEE